MEGSGTNRLEAFSDGVFAIAATLLVLSFTATADATLGSQLLDLWPAYLAYATSFLPFPTRLVAESARLGQGGERAAVLTYATTFVLMAVVYNVWWRYASRSRRLIREDVPDSTVRAINRAFDPGVPLYVLTFALAFWSPIASVVLTFAIAAFYLPSAALFERGR